VQLELAHSLEEDIMHRSYLLAAAGPLALGLLAFHQNGSGHRAFLDSLAPQPAVTASTMPSNGDQNPYGIAVVPAGFHGGGPLHAGDILVSNFNNSNNLQGTGRTIVAFTPGGDVLTTFTMPDSLGPVGLTTALFALRSGLIIVGNTPTTDGSANTISNGSLIFLDEAGRVVLNLSDSALLRGPWDMTADDSDEDEPILYVSNVLDGTVTRIDLSVSCAGGRSTPKIESLTRIGSGFLHRTDPNALVVGPTGLLLGEDRDSLFVADTGNNRIQHLVDVRHAHRDLGSGVTVVSGPPLKGPLALARSPFGTIIASNGDAAGDPQTPPNMVVEILPERHLIIASRQLDDSGTPGGIFGITIAKVEGVPSLLYVNDNSVTMNVLKLER
jgi:hypothetical protein